MCASPLFLRLRPGRRVASTRFVGAILLLTAAIANYCAPTLARAQDISFALGYREDQNRLRSHFLILDEDLSAAVSRIGDRVVRASARPDIRFTFRVINESQVNAYATAGGFVYINSGLLDELGSEDELAAVLAHEITHIDENHLAKAIGNAKTAKIAGTIGGFAVGVGLAALGVEAHASPDPQVFELGSLVGRGLAAFEIRGFGRDEELEADRQAIRTLHRAGYDPYVLIRVFKKMQLVRERSGNAGPAYQTAMLNASPGLEERIRRVEAALVERDPPGDAK